MSEDFALVKVTVDVDEARRFVRAIVREELAATGSAVTGRATAPRSWLCKRQAAIAAGITVKKLYRLLRAGVVKTSKEGGGRVLVHVPSVLAALDGKAPAPPTDALAWARARSGRGGK